MLDYFSGSFELQSTVAVAMEILNESN